jgi:hypothetical protein
LTEAGFFLFLTDFQVNHNLLSLLQNGPGDVRGNYPVTANMDSPGNYAVKFWKVVAKSPFSPNFRRTSPNHWEQPSFLLSRSADQLQQLVGE